MRLVVMIVVFTALLVAPIADEIIGSSQFHNICKKAVLELDAKKIKGKHIRIDSDPTNQPLRGTAIPIYYSRYVFRDIETDEEYGTNYRFTAKSGWLFSRLGFDSPLIPVQLLGSNVCSGPGNLPTSKKYGFTYVYREELKGKMK